MSLKPSIISSVPSTLEVSFYKEALRQLTAAGIPFLVGGAFALREYTPVVRATKDLDVFLKPVDQARAMALFRMLGFHVETTAPHWITKVFSGLFYVDFIFGLANGVGQVDDQWFARSRPGIVFDIPVKLIPPEEMLWSKAFIMDRDRFDGADINHLILYQSESLDWARLQSLFAGHWRVFLSTLLLFGFVYPSKRQLVPEALLKELLAKALAETNAPSEAAELCQGTLLSRSQYAVDIDSGAYADVRTPPYGSLTSEQTRQ
jgi:hypothetical protein